MEICAVDKLAVQRNMTRQRKPRIVMVGAVEVCSLFICNIRFYARTNIHHGRLNAIQGNIITKWIAFVIHCGPLSSLSSAASCCCCCIVPFSVFCSRVLQIAECHTIQLGWLFVYAAYEMPKKNTQNKRKQAWKSNLWYTLVLKAVHKHAKRNEMRLQKNVSN